jgi:hypothetical protein
MYHIKNRRSCGSFMQFFSPSRSLLPACRQLSKARFRTKWIFSTRHAAYSAQSSLTAVRPHVVVFTGDRVISQFVDGGSWVTAITVTNSRNPQHEFKRVVFQNDDSDFNVRVGLSGLSR